ncbi:hypothetical protein M885DRAFT_620291 [Pelagophyceae sp. CCMP2097]|nr:hypothetical protein M885DRAFT_620291 [Pelagophyceae sp. CCMP2097]
MPSMLSALAVCGVLRSAAGFGQMAPECESTTATDEVTAGFVGGTLYVYDPAGTAVWAEVHDLGDVAVEAEMAPKTKPHMVRPSPDGRLVAISYTGDKVVDILDASTKNLVARLDATHPAPGIDGGAMHDGAWHGNDEFIIADMTGFINGIGGGALHKFTVSTATHVSSLGMGSTSEDRGTAKTKPISLGTNSLGAFGDFYFVTDAFGAGSIISAVTMTVLKNLPLEDFAPCAGGGLWVEAHPVEPMIVVAQYGAQGDASECLVSVNLGTMAIEGNLEMPAGADDAHGLQFCTSEVDQKVFLINTNRVSATLDILEFETGAVVLNEFDLNAGIPSVISSGKRVLQPDVIYFDQTVHRLFIAARGPEPLSAVKAQNFFEDATPGLFSFTISPDCSEVEFVYGSDVALLTDLSLPHSGNVGDVHGIWGVNGQIWAVDQAATGFLQTKSTFHKCAADEL